MSTGEQLVRAWLELMQVRTPVEDLANLWADWMLTWQQAAMRAVGR